MDGLPAVSIGSEKYDVLRELGRGGMGVVYLAEDRQLKRHVALKVLYDHLNRDDIFVRRFQEEARSVSTLHHPNIVCVHGLDRSSNVIAIDMEYVEGQSLEFYRTSSTLTPHMVVGIARDILGGLATCHQINIVHRDIKPSNILVNLEGIAKITDFGLATAYASHLEATVCTASSGFYMGTPRYMPLPAWEGEQPDPSWDLYSFGVVLFELLTGRTAFEGSNPMAVMKRQFSEPLPPIGTVTTGLSPALARLVDRLVQPAGPGEDYSSVEALGALQKTPEYLDLRQSNASGTLLLPPPRAVKKRRRSVRYRRPAGPILGGLVAASAIAAALWWTIRPPGQPAAPPAAGRIPPGATAVFAEMNALDSAAFGSATWMVERDESGRPQTITAISELGLMSLAVGAGDAGPGLPVTGAWAAAISAENRLAQFGSLSGSLAWDPAGGTLVLAAERVRERDGERVTYSAYGMPRSPGYDTESFLRALEGNAVLQYLIYGELLPRAQPWAIALESRLPALRGGRVTVPAIAEAIGVDGQLDEPTWVYGAFDTTGRIGEVRLAGTQASAPLLIRWTEEAVYVASRVRGAGTAPVFELGIMPSPEVSVTRSGRFYVSVNGAGALTSRHLVGPVELPWQCDWAIAMAAEDGDLLLEARIPLDSLKDGARPREDKRWRFNARLSAEMPGGVRETAGNWSSDDLESLEHGVLLVFRSSPASPAPPDDEGGGK